METPSCVIELVVFFVDPQSHQEGVNRYVGGKERRRVRLSCEELSSFSRFSEAIAKKAGLRDEAIERGLGKETAIKIARIEKGSDGTKCFGITNQDSLDLEGPEFQHSSLQVHVVKKHLAFTKHCPTIQVVEASSSTTFEGLRKADIKQESATKRHKKTNSVIIHEEDAILLKRLRQNEAFARNERQADNLRKMEVGAGALEGSLIINEVTIKCGRCLKSLAVPFDRSPAMRVQYFKKRHFDVPARCKVCPTRQPQSSEKSGTLSKASKQGTLTPWLKVPPPKSSTTDIDSDLDVDDDVPVDCKMESDDQPMDATTVEDNDSDLDDTEETEEMQLQPVMSSDSDLENDAEESDVTQAINSDSETDYFVFPLSLSQADSVCVRLNELIESGRIPRHKILYKFLDDITNVLIDPNHAYDNDVLEFFNTIQYLGGNRTVNFIRGPMWHGTGSGGKKDPQDAKMNLGGPSSFARQKKASGYTTKSGVVKPWLIAMLKMTAVDTHQPLVHNQTVSVTAVCLANDSTAVKPAIVFDDKQALNIGLRDPVDATFVQQNPDPSPHFLRENIVTEANVTCVTTADNHISMPVAVTYMTKRGKTGEYVKKQLLKEVRIIQTCAACVNEARSSCSIIDETDVDHCQSDCAECTNDKKVCETCTQQGHTSHISALRACSKCMRKSKKCIKAVVLLLAADCEQGNKSAFEKIIIERETGVLDSSTFLFSVLPDPVHVGKSLKASFANWPIMLEGQRSCLTRLQTLRDTKTDLKRLLPRNAVVNKDRMDVSAILHLTDESVLNFLSATGPVVHTILPDSHKISDSNKRGLYPHPIAICCGKTGTLHALDYVPLKGVSKLLEIRQHVPADITVLGEYSEARCLDGSPDGSVLICEHNKAIRVYPKQMAALALQKLRRPELLQELGKRKLPMVGTVPVLRNRLREHLQSTKKKYDETGTELDKIHLTERLLPSCFCRVTENSLVVASDEQKAFFSVNIASDGVVFKGECTILSKYPQAVHKVTSMTIHRNAVYAVHNGQDFPGGFIKVDLESHLCSCVLSNETAACVTCVAVTSSEKGLVFCDSGTNQVKSLTHTGDISVLAGSGQEGNRDGCATEASFSQLTDAAVDQNTVFVCDGQTGAIKMIAGLSGTISFLRHLGSFYGAFGVHLKHKRPKKPTLQQCMQQVNTIRDYLRSTVATRQLSLGTARQLNGPEGTVSARTMKSVEIVSTELKHLRDFLNETADESFQFDVESTLTLCVENLHAVGHFKQQFPTMLEHARNLSNTVRESLKRVTTWAAMYYTHRESYYPVPHHSLKISEISQMDALQPRQKLTDTQKHKMRDWASDHGKAVRQRTVRQQTTMFSAGTLPLNMYNTTTCPTDKVALPGSSVSSEDSEGDVHEDLPVESTLEEDTATSLSQSSQFVQIDTYDTDSSVDSADDDTESDSETPRCLDFLVGTVSRRGRQIRFRLQ